MLLFCLLRMVCKVTQEASLYFLNDKHVRNDKIPLLIYNFGFFIFYYISSERYKAPQNINF